jgi:type VI secretion system protein ImpL
MKLDWASGAAFAVCLLIGIAGGLALHLKGVQLILFMALLALIGVAAAAVIMYFKSRNEKPAAAAPAPEPGGDSEIDGLVREADRRLAHANAGATIANLPLIFVIGDRATAKTSTVVNSGIEPELLAGQLYQDNMIAPTRSANLWFARGTALVEAGGAILGDPGNWMRLVKRLQPGKLKSLKGGAQSPRAVLLAVSMESFSQGADAVAAATRYLQARLADIAQTLGIRFPVYILFTKTDRLPFFTDFVGTFSNEEANQVFGVTVPIRPAQQSGVYAEDETRRITGYFDNLFYSLCDKRTIFPPRDNDIEKVCGAYEFPREMRKTRDALVRFMVDLCRPSQLTTSPFLRGFYFSGVRPVVVNESAPVITGRPQPQPEQQGATGATGMFRVGKQAEMVAQQSVAQPAAASRRVPQWVFLGHLFNSIILGDTAAMSTSGSSVKVSALRRGLLIAASVVCLILTGFFLVSYLGNHRLEQDALTAAQSIDSKDLPADKLPALESLQQLERLRQSLDTLDGYETDGAPYRLRWGLYQGSDLYPEVRRLYFAKFHALLFGQTQAGLLKYMQQVKSPPDPSADFGYPYDTLKAYLLTTGEYKRANDKVLQDFLGNLLFARWSGTREAEINKDRMDLAKKQFDYYARALGTGNPYSSKPDGDAVDRTRVYLSGFKGVQRAYKALLDVVLKKGKPKDFNHEFDGTAARARVRRTC